MNFIVLSSQQSLYLTITPVSFLLCIYANVSENFKLVKLPRKTPKTTKYIILKLGHVGLPEHLNPADFHMAEAYSLVISAPSTITIVGPTQAGVFYGIQTLLSLASDSKGTLRVPLVNIVDAPRFR